MVEILMRGQADEQRLTAVIRAWMENFPEDAQEFMDAMNEFRKTLRKDNGVSLGLTPFGGASAVEGHIPMRIFTYVERYMPGYWESPGAKQKFFQLFKKAGIKGA